MTVPTLSRPRYCNRPDGAIPYTITHTRAEMVSRRLTLSLSAGEAIPTTANWLIEDGYLIASSWDHNNEPIAVGVWGPGDVVIPSAIPIEPLMLSSLSAVELQECVITTTDEQAFQEQLCTQLTQLLQASRTRPAELRLLTLLIWLGRRFGRVNSQGVSLSFSGMNLTHRNLALISGLTRVTVTKALSRFKQDGQLRKLGADELISTAQQSPANSDKRRL